LVPTSPLANADHRWFVLLEYDLDQLFCQPLIGLWLLGTRWSGASVVNPIGHLFWTFYFYYGQITVPIGLITGASGRSWFLLEDVTDFKIFWTSNSLTSHIRVRIVRVVETESYPFLGKWIILLLPATHIKLVTIALIAFHRFSLLPSHLPLPSPFTAQWLTPLFMLPLVCRLVPMTQGTTRGGKCCDGGFFFSNSWCHKNGKGEDSRTHRLLQEDDRDQRRPPGVPRPWMADR
jgi:hypothetical protein